MFYDHHRSGRRDGPPPRFVCWSRMQAEAGQELDAIIARKELERVANGGIFLWGVGNAPGGEPARLARESVPVDLVLSMMKSKPKPVDRNPSAILVWTRYLDERGIERELPAGSLVTSRAPEAGSRSRGHYALMARSERPLSLGDLGPFNPAAYRNVGGRGAEVGSSQVTALLRLAAPDAVDTAGYRAAVKATLVGGYWVRLLDPVRVAGRALIAFREEWSERARGNVDEWIEAVAAVRRGPARDEPQRRLFDVPFAKHAAAG